MTARKARLETGPSPAETSAIVDLLVEEVSAPLRGHDAEFAVFILNRAARLLVESAPRLSAPRRPGP